MSYPNGSEFIKLHFNDDVRNNTDEVNCIIKAIKEWNCLTGINMQLANDTNIKGDNTDKTFVIYKGPPTINDAEAKALANTVISGHYTCVNSNDTSQWFSFVQDVDIKYMENLNHISPMAQWWYDTSMVEKPAGKIDFYAVILHELGHLHLLKHINNPNEIMWHSASSLNQTPGVNRLKAHTSPMSFLGALTVIDISENTAFPISCDINSFYSEFPLNCDTTPAHGGGGFISKLMNNTNQNIKVYPNPTSDFIRINFENTELSDNIFISITDILGKEVSTFTPKQVRSFEVPVSEFQKGVYLLKVKLNEDVSTFKITVN